jgi:hypothetical protein
VFVCKCVLYYCHRVFVCKCVLYYCHRVFVCKCVLYYCHRASKPKQLTKYIINTCIRQTYNFKKRIKVTLF